MLIILLISFGSCRNEEILENTENSKEQLTLIKSKSLWKENITFISQVKRVFDKKVDAKKFSKKHGSAYWEYALSFEKNGEPYIFVPIVKDNQVEEVMLVLKEKKKIRFYFNKDDKSKKAFFDIIIKEKSAKAGSNVRKGNASNRLVCGWREIVWVWNTEIEKTTYEYFCVDVSLSYIDTDLGGGSGFDIDDGDLPGGGDVGNPIDTTKVKTPCEKAIAPSTTATTYSKTTTFNNAKTSISGMNNNKENGVVFGNINGTTQSTWLQTGGEHSITLTHSFADPTGDLHNHTDNTPPSPGDFYSLINARNSFSNYNTRYVTTPDGTIYALVVTDLAAMNTFLQNYPPYQSNPNMSPNFSGQMFDDWFNFIFNGYGNEEMALSYVLDKYNTGIALTKLENNEFRKINIQQENINGETTYKQTSCP